MACLNCHRCHTPNCRQFAYRSVRYLLDLGHGHVLDAALAQNSFCKCRSHHRWRSGRRTFALDCHLCFYKQHISKFHSDFDKAACLFPNIAKGVDVLECFAEAACACMSSISQKSIVCNGMEMKLHCSRHCNCRISNDLHKPGTRS